MAWNGREGKERKRKAIKIQGNARHVMERQGKTTHGMA
jgi:hypothetical protein